ncbi:MAG: biliverdin-producing heme oxygenase [Deltaproteobacteria bacterium]
MVDVDATGLEPPSRRGESLGSAPSALERIRMETRTLHHQLESVVPILEPGAEEQTYRHYLEKLLGFHRPLEPVLFSRSGLRELGIRRAEREKAPWLARDLLGLGLRVEDLALLPVCRSTPRLVTLGNALGCCYALECATLEAQLIFQELPQRLPRAMATASSYLRCYGPQTRSMWNLFISALEHHGRDESVQREMVATARETFSQLRDWLLLGDRTAANGSWLPAGTTTLA